MQKGDKIRVLYEESNQLYFQYLPFESDSLNKLYNTDTVFSVDKEVFEQLVRPVYKMYKGAVLGAYSIPFRLRGSFTDDFDFESSLSLQANAVFGFGSKYKTESLVDASFEIEVTGVNLNSKNSNVTVNRTASALTFSLGGLVKPSDKINFGVFVGWYILGKNDRDVDMVFNNKLWIGLGINISFNKIEDKMVTTNSKHN